MQDKITSPSNPRIKKIQTLRKRKARGKDHCTLIEGYRENEKALRSGIRFDEIYVCPELLDNYDKKYLTKKMDAPITVVNKSVFAKMAYGDRLEGILSLATVKPLSLHELKVKSNGLFVVVENVEKPGNLGAILRSCDGAGVDAVMVCDDKTDIYSPNVIRSSIGTCFSVQTLRVPKEKALDFLRSHKIQVYATLPKAKTLYTQCQFKNPSAFVLGSEQKGLSDFWKKHCDQQIQIPMRGQADSLNVSTTTAILLYEAVRQRAQ